MNNRLKEALERQDTRNPWAAWDRDKNGNDPATEDAALDKELAEHLKTNCSVCFKADVPVDKDDVCDDCLLKEAEEQERDARGALLPGWSTITDYKDGTCVECGAPESETKKGFCGDDYCIGVGFEDTQCCSKP